MEEEKYFRIDKLCDNGLNHLKDSYEWYIKEVESNPNAYSTPKEIKENYKRFLRFYQDALSLHEYVGIKNEMILYYRMRIDYAYDFLGEESDPDYGQHYGDSEAFCLIEFSSKVIELLEAA